MTVSVRACLAWLAEARGWRSWGVMFALGAMATLAFAPFGALPVFYLTFPLLALSLGAGDTRPGWRTAFARGWWFAFGHQVAGWYWISNALLIFSADFWWMVPFAAIGLPAVLAVYYGIATALAARLPSDLARPFALALAWALADWLRGHLATGFPWNLAGYAWGESLLLSQSAAYLGVYGVGVLALVAACAPAVPLSRAARGHMIWTRASILVTLAAVLLPVIAAGHGAQRLSSAGPLERMTWDGVGIRIVQGGIPQREKWDRRYQRRNFGIYAELSQRDRPDWVRHIVWPETAATFYIQDQQLARQTIASFLPPEGLLLTGAPLREESPRAVHNGMAVIDARGRLVARYAKAHLVPFGEYVPFAEILPIRAVAGGIGSYSPGPGPQTLVLPGMPPVSPLICYEVIFPAAVTDPIGPRPEWILNLTNDAWYGKGTGPYQHLAQTRLRAVEEGLPMVRAASTGVSAGFDGFGRELGRVPLGEAGILDIRLPASLGETVYSRYGDTMYFLLCAILGIIIFAINRFNE